MICVKHDNETLRYAASELEKYLTKLDPYFDINSDEIKIQLGYLDDFGISKDGIEDPALDDVIDICINGKCGHVAGSNSRSVLMGVYDLLKSLGCRWVRPGDDGEYIPSRKITDLSFTYHHKADHRYRGQCIEGSISYEHVRDTVFFLPKIHMNLFMMEQVTPFNYMSRWYNHIGNPYRQCNDCTLELLDGYVAQLERDIKKCGLQLHALGHGYVTEPYGIRYTTRDAEYNVSNEAAESFALVNGQRKLFKNSPFFTQPCLSKDWVRKNLVDWLVSYMEKKPYIDLLHVWLSDAINNHCECEECLKKSPTDHYITLLNELDAALSAKGIDTKIVFIMYTDTLWPPKLEQFINSDRFILTTAVSKPLSQTFDQRPEPIELPKQDIRKYPGSFGLSGAVSFLEAWKPYFSGEAFVYEYYLYTKHFSDPGYTFMSKYMATDAKNVKSLGFDGIMSDQTQRSFFPNGLPLSTLGEALYDVSLDEDKYFDEYYEACYGEEWHEVKSYLEAITFAFDPDNSNSFVDVVVEDTGVGDIEAERAKAARGTTLDLLARVPEITKGFSSAVKRNLASVTDPCHKKSWELLALHLDYCNRFAEIKSVALSENYEKTKELINTFVNDLFKVEDSIHPQFDTVLFKQFCNSLIPKEKR